MDDATGQLAQILEEEETLHRDLLAMARTRHILMREARLSELAALRAAEAAKVAALRRLEALRSQLQAVGRTSEAASVTAATRRIAALVRRIGAVERANRALAARYAARLQPVATGVVVWP